MGLIKEIWYENKNKIIQYKCFNCKKILFKFIGIVEAVYSTNYINYIPIKCSCGEILLKIVQTYEPIIDEIIE